MPQDSISPNFNLFVVSRDPVEVGLNHIERGFAQKLDGGSLPFPRVIEDFGPRIPYVFFPCDLFPPVLTSCYHSPDHFST